MLDQTLTWPENPKKLRSFPAQLPAGVKARAILSEKLRHQMAGYRAHQFWAHQFWAHQFWAHRFGAHRFWGVIRDGRVVAAGAGEGAIAAPLVQTPCQTPCQTPWRAKLPPQ